VRIALDARTALQVALDARAAVRHRCSCGRAPREGRFGAVATPRAQLLVVEDDTDCREALVEFLAQLGFAAAAACDGVAALESLRASPLPDAVITDLRMPRMDGEQLVAEMQREARLASVPVLVMSGAPERPAPPGVAGIVYKPFQLDALERALQAVLDERDGARAATG
jgi:two-component system, chemotaxis family, chemotaxis protein CheY